MAVQQLRFRPDGTFTIVQFTDLHWRDGDDLDYRTRVLMERVLDTEKPDMVALTGDVIDGSQCSNPAQSWREAVVPMEDRGIPWAAVFGNHDDEGSMSREQLMEVQLQCSNCLSQAGPADLPGIGNYVLHVLHANGESIAARLYFLDSGSLSPDNDGEYAWITSEQIDWFMRIARHAEQTDGPAVAGTQRTPSLVFFHIPIPEFDELSRHGWIGNKLEEVCGPKFNSGFFSSLSRSGNVLGVFVGHDHLNDFEVEHDGIRLCYGRSTGYGTYGREGFPRGARVIRLQEGERGFLSWIRVDGGADRLEVIGDQ
jgi:3',5'-cyclic AMP phosphodiesterase CpdA